MKNNWIFIIGFILLHACSQRENDSSHKEEAGKADSIDFISFIEGGLKDFLIAEDLPLTITGDALTFK